ncbi:hypothetical protein [Corynebacterium alimapuense]|uniref:DUF4230 domain-containing protein n=1 Tax=Corynebacterium alimapuense TaxID=1576874 RepID=A0A3M8K6K0_9CORY|nr:hypothetical protein [Corynebacterium alimapuense]RNE48499.1 hypothetical protein C5L39_08350 [Corynebacterium alimapuense]
MKKWISLISVAIVLMAVVGAGAFFGGSAWALKNTPILDDLVEVEVVSNDEKIITAIERQEQLVLLSTNVQGLSEERVNRSFLGRTLIGSERTQFLQYSYRAKFGIEGSEVTVTETDDNQYLIVVPKFIFIGHDSEQFKTAIENNGALSWATPEIDTARTITSILNAETKAEQINDNRDLLEDQARAFYLGIIHSIDDQVEVQFEFL